MNSRRYGFLAGLASGILLFLWARPAAAAPDSLAIQQFKHFLSTPPSVESVVFSEREPPDPQHPERLDLPLASSEVFRYYEGRFQGDAFLLRELPNPDAVSDLRVRGLLVADDGTASWFHYARNSRNGIIDFASGVGNEVHRSTFMVWHNLRQVLTLGIMRSAPGSVEWHENKFRVARSDEGVSAWGDLKVSQDGAVDALNLTYRLDSGDVHWVIRYGYDGDKSTGLPFRIRCYLLQSGGEFEIADFRIYELRISPTAMTDVKLRLASMIASNKWETLIHSNDAIYLLAGDGMVKRMDVTRRALSPNEGSRHLAQVPASVYTAWAATNASIFILVLRMKAKLNQMKTKRAL